MIPGLKRIETYVLARTLLAVVAALAVISSVIILIGFVDLSRSVGTRVDVNFLQIMGLDLLQAPAVILVLLPFTFLFGTLAAFVALNRRSEPIAMRAAGVSAWRFIFPAAGAAFVIGVLSVTVLNPVAAALTQQFDKTRAALMQGYLQGSPNEKIWLREGDGRTQIVIRALKRDDVAGDVRLKGVSLFVYTLNKQGVLDFSRRIEADQALLSHGEWKLKGVKEATPGAEALHYDSLAIPSTLTGRAAVERFVKPDAIAFWNLPAAIDRMEQSGFSATTYRLRFQQLLATAPLFAAMSILAAAFSLRLMRLGGLAGLAGSGVALGFVLFFFNQMCGALGKAEVIAPFAAAWAPPVLALLSGFTLLCYTEDG